MDFNLIGDTEPFLHCHLEVGESIFCESDAMIMMESGLELKGQMRSGIFQSVVRRFATGESLFQQKIEAVRSAGDCLLAPQLDGDIEILDIKSGQRYCLNDGAFVACSETVEMKGEIQRNIGSALFGQTGGFVILKTEGHGKLAVTGKGVIFGIDVTHDNPVTIDNGHVVCWEETLEYSLSINSSNSESRGLMGNIINSVTGGEGFVLKFRGQGKVYLSSRNPNAYSNWVQGLVNG